MRESRFLTPSGRRGASSRNLGTLNLGLNFRCPLVNVDQRMLMLTVCVVGQIPHSYDAVDGGGG